MPQIWRGTQTFGWTKKPCPQILVIFSEFGTGLTEKFPVLTLNTVHIIFIQIIHLICQKIWERFLVRRVPSSPLKGSNSVTLISKMAEGMVSYVISIVDHILISVDLVCEQNCQRCLVDAQLDSSCWVNLHSTMFIKSLQNAHKTDFEAVCVTGAPWWLFLFLIPWNPENIELTGWIGIWHHLY